MIQNTIEKTLMREECLPKTSLVLDDWVLRFHEEFLNANGVFDPAHDILHIKRVTKNALALAGAEGGNLEIVIPACWLHDMVNVPKDHPDRSKASTLSAQAAATLLVKLGYPDRFVALISHAIEAHSFSAQIPCRTLEAQIVQDADRLDGLGAVGIARCFVVGGQLGRPLYAEQDPFCRKRSPGKFSIDHFFEKLLKLPESFQTKSGRAEADRRVQFMQSYLSQFESEILSDGLHQV